VTEDEALDLLTLALHEVAPEADFAHADPDGPLQEEFELDSIDFLGVVEAVRDRTGIDIPDRDFPSLSTAHSFATYVAARSGP